MMRSRSALRGLACLAVGLVSSFHTALGDWNEMSARLPAQTNAIVAINVDGLLSSPMAVKEDWARRWNEAYDGGSVALNSSTQRVLTGLLLTNSLRQSQWKITQIESRQPIPLADVARSEGGYIDKVWDRMAVVTPERYFVSLSPTTFATVTPANHQGVARWLRAPRTAQGMGLESERLKSIVNNLGTRSHIVMAVDVEDLRTATEIRRGLELSPVPGLDAAVDLDLLASSLAGIKTVILSSRAMDKYQAELTVEMSASPEWLLPYAKPLAAEFIARIGLDVPEVEQWTVSADGNALRFSGAISGQGMADILSTMGVRTMRPAVGPSDDPKVIGETSRKFYRALVGALDSFPRPLTYPKAIAWTNRQAAVIEHMPVTNVDPELVTWSNELAYRFRDLTLALAQDQAGNQAEQAAVNAQRAYGYSAYAYSGYYGYDGSVRAWGYHGASNAAVAAQRAADAERAKVMRQNQAESLKRIGVIMDGMGAKRSAIRAAMSAKYGIEF